MVILVDLDWLLFGFSHFFDREIFWELRNEVSIPLDFYFFIGFGEPFFRDISLRFFDLNSPLRGV